MDFDTSDMEFEIKDEVKEEIIDEILKGAQEAIENANLELKADDGIDTEDLFCLPPPPTVAVELNAVETEFDGRPEKRPRNSISKARVNCSLCPKSFSTSKALQEHTLNLHTSEHDELVEFPCIICVDCNFIDQKSLEKHIKQYHITNVSVLLSRDGSLLKCSHCPRLFLVQKDLNSHVESEHTNPLEVDPLSTTTLSVGTETTLEISTTRHKHKCPHCSFAFLLSQSLQEHIIKIHVKHKAFPCHICANLSKSKVESFIDEQSLGQHIKSCHSHVREGEPAKSRLKCPQCDKTYSRKGHLTYHIKFTHSGPVSRVQCPQCPLSFAHNSGLRMHRNKCGKKHCESTGGKTEPGPESIPKCPHCDKYLCKRFLRNHILVKHLKVPKHLLKCYIRDKKYTLDNLLKEPLPEKLKDQDTVKTQKKKIKAQTTKSTKCRYCNETFLNHQELRRHIIEIHVKQKKIAEKEYIQSHAKKTKGDSGKESEPETSAKNQCQPSASRVQCPKCPSTFSNSKHLQYHIMLLHAQKEEFPCLICTSRDQGSSSRNPESGTEMKSQNFIFEDEIGLNQHMTNIHYSTHTQNKNVPEPEKVRIVIPKNKICPICSKSFDGKWAASNYRGHMQTHLDIKRYSCEHCSKKFATKISLHSHLIRYHNYNREQLNLKYTCQLCAFITLTQSLLSYHMSRKHPYAQLQLGHQMNTDSQTETSLNHGNSRSKSSTKNPLQSAMCFVCSKSQTSKSNLIQHLKEHRGEGRFYCDLCPRDYRTRMLLLTHLKLGHHKLAYCNKCFTSFSVAAAFNQHILNIDGATLNSNPSENGNSRASNLRCEICDTILKSPCLFKIHTISHLKEIQEQESNFPDDEVVSADNIFKCNVCPKVFDRQSYLNEHLEIVHENPQECSRFQCHKCERNYKFVSELKSHYLLTHSSKINQQVNQNQSAAAVGEFGFECDICLTKFGTESELTSHQDNFRSEVICHICAAKFKCNSALTLHLKRVHKTDNYSYKHLCHICPSTFFEGKELRRHVERVHENKFKKRRRWESAEKTVEYESEALRECNSNSNNKISSSSLGVEPEIKSSVNHGSSKNKNNANNPTKSELVCHVCSKMQSTKFNLTQHLKEHRGEQRAYCDLCPRDFCSRFHLMAHLKLDHHKLAYCNKCLTSFADKEALDQHLLHTDVPTLKSNQTIKSQSSENADPPASNLKCEICGESCKSPCLFKIHSISHLKEIQQQELNILDDVVSVDNIFKCSLCPSAFDRQSYLDAHLNIVHENPPFRCGKCERTYRSRNELKSHDLVVHSPKINQHINQSHTSKVSDAKLDLFECSTCSSKFLTQSELTNHQDIFESVLPCHICSTKFKCSISLKTHIRRVHGRKRKDLVCGFCLSKFSGSYDLRRHVQRVHEGKNKNTKN